MKREFLIICVICVLCGLVAGCGGGGLTAGASGLGGLVVGYSQAIAEANQTINELNQQVILTEAQIAGLQSGLIELSKDPNKMAAFRQIITLAQSGGLVDANSVQFAENVARAYFDTYTMTGQTKKLVSEWPKATGTGLISLLITGYALLRKNGIV